jgi:adenosylcobinamide-GDP ribazoletransferase
MKQPICKEIAQWQERQAKSFFGSVIFYTTIPLTRFCQGDFQRIARWAPCIGLLVGGLLGVADAVLENFKLPLLVRSAAIAAMWLALTGGLHLDGAMDTADGLAASYNNRDRRLEVMRDSLTGAFGVMAAVIILLLKTTALSEMHSYRWLGLMGAAGWGRWGQVAAIAFYPYLRATGKGAFHKHFFRSPQDLLLGLTFLLGLSGLALWLDPQRWWLGVGMLLSGSAIALLSGFWFYLQLGGHTGDTYGAIVEWTEALFLGIFTGLLRDR